MKLEVSSEIEMYCDIRGKGTPILFLHAYPMNHTIWRPQVDGFADQMLTITYDVRGFGKSDAPHDPKLYSQDISVQDLLGVLDGLELDKAIVCGLSMGGNIALHFCLNYPERANALVLVDTAAGSEDPEAFARTTNGWADIAEEEGMQAFADLIMANSIFGEYAERGEGERDFMRQVILSNSVQGVANTARRVLAPRAPVFALEQRLGQIGQPTLVVVGERDTACLDPGRFLAATIPDAQIAVIPNAGHFNNLEEPGIFNRILGNFIQSLNN